MFRIFTFLVSIAVFVCAVTPVVAQLALHDDGIAFPDGTKLTSADGNRYERILVVAKSGGDFDTVGGALADITDAATDRRYLVWIAPGVYEEQVFMKSFVDIEGAGSDLTVLTASVGRTVYPASSSRLKGVTVVNTDEKAIAQNNLTGVTFEDMVINVDTSGAGTRGYGMVFGDVDDLVLRDLEIHLAVGDGPSSGLYVDNSGRDGMIRGSRVTVECTASGGSACNGMNLIANDPYTMKASLESLRSTANGYDVEGVKVYGGGIDLTLVDPVVRVHASVGGFNADGLEMGGGSSVKILGGSLIATDEDSGSQGLAMRAGTFADLLGTEVAGGEHGLWLFASTDDAAEIQADSCTIAGGSSWASAYTPGSPHVGRFGSCQLSPSGAVLSDLDATCVGCYDGNYTNGNGYLFCP